MESPHIHGGPTINHEKSPGGRLTGQKQNDPTDHNLKQNSELRPAGKRPRRRKKGLKAGEIQEPSQETGNPPLETQVKEGKLNEKVSSGKKVSATQDHGKDAGRPWTDQNKNGDQRIPSQYNLRNAQTPVSYTRYFENMDDEEW